MAGKRASGVNMRGDPFVGRSGLEDRRALVLKMKLEGVSNEAIAVVLKIHRNTVSNDLKAIRKDQAATIQQMDSDEEIGAAIDYYLMIRDQAFQQYSESKSDRAKLGFLEASIRAQERVVKLLLDVGVMAKEPAKIAQLHGGSIQLSLNDEKIRKLTTVDLETKRTKLLTGLGSGSS